MKVLLAKPRGFCAGVNMAVQALDKAITKFGVPFYVFHEIVHNTHIVSYFRDRGAVFVDSLDDVPQGNHVMFSAHGVSPQIRRLAQERKLIPIDATCPLVRKVHDEVKRFVQEGFQIILIGHPGHDEVVAVIDEAPERITLVSSAEDVDSLVFNENRSDAKIAYVMQTTLSVVEAEKIVAKLKERFPHIKGPSKNDICFATQNRQEAVRNLVSQADVLLVVGSTNSSNSRRLAEIGHSLGIRSFLIDGPDNIPLDSLQKEETVLITSGASAPEALVQKTLKLLDDVFGITVEERVFREETLQFALPREIRKEE